jgi:hypothetical protein
MSWGRSSNFFWNHFDQVIRLKSTNALPHRAELMHAAWFFTNRKTLAMMACGITGVSKDRHLSGISEERHTFMSG